MKRTCDNCRAWGTATRARSPTGTIRKVVCHFNPKPETNDADYWCRQHSENTGWDWQEKEKMPLERCILRAKQFSDEVLTDVRSIKDYLDSDLHQSVLPRRRIREIAEELQERCEKFEPLDMI